MSEYKRPQSEQEFDQNFKQIKPLMSDTEAYYESSRCLFCYDAPCINACPTGIDIPLFIRQINTGNEMGSAKTIYDSNVFGYACGKVCPTEVLCEGACVYNHQDVKPIEIGRLQSYATGKAIQQNKKLYNLAPATGKKIAVIGAGPAGISCACDLRMYGHSVDIFEAKAKPSGLTVYGVAPYKITNEEALNEMEYLQNQFGFEVHYNQPIQSEVDLQKLESEYDAIFIGIGLGETRDLKLPGEDLENCWGAVEFINELRTLHHKAPSGTRVIVIGGGNTAMDAASESARMGAENVILAYRRDKESMGAYDFEYDLAKGVGVKGMFNVAPLEILGNKNENLNENKNGRVSGVRFIRTEVVDGRVRNIPGTEFTESCDWVIKATGQSKQVGFLGKIKDLELDAKGRIVVDSKFQTGNPKYFAAGDAVNGGVEVVNAVAEAGVAAKGVDGWLKG